MRSHSLTKELRKDSELLCSMIAIFSIQGEIDTRKENFTRIQQKGEVSMHCIFTSWVCTVRLAGLIVILRFSHLF